MISLEEIKKPIEKELNDFSTAFKQTFETKNEILAAVNNYLTQNFGKQIRPLLTILSAKICGEVNKNTIDTAVSLELLHTASLIHDDIVDDTYERRGRKSINAIWKNKISVLVGDYLLSQSLAVATKTKNIYILDLITNLGKELSDGELLQISNVNNISTDEKKYFEVISKKTATLLSVCTKSGALTSTTDERKIESLNEFGKIYGICFQIKDDIFDYISSEKEIGKPVGNDIREGKITLPLLYALNNSQNKEKEQIFNILKNKDFTKENVNKLIKFAIDEGGIKYAEQKMEEFKQKAIETLNIFEDSQYKKSLLLTLQHTIDRKK